MKHLDCPFCPKQKLKKVPVPRGEKFICESCGADFSNTEYLDYRKQLTRKGVSK